MAQENFVVYTPEIDAIIKEEVKRSPKNLSEGFRQAAERIEKEVGEKNISMEKVQARYYLKFNKRKASTENGNGNRTATKAPANTKANTVKTVAPNTNVTEEITDEKYLLVKGFVDGLTREKKLRLIKEAWDSI